MVKVKDYDFERKTEKKIPILLEREHGSYETLQSISLRPPREHALYSEKYKEYSPMTVFDIFRRIQPQLALLPNNHYTMHFMEIAKKKPIMTLREHDELGGFYTPGWLRGTIFDVDHGRPCRLIRTAELDGLHRWITSNSVLVVRNYNYASDEEKLEAEVIYKQKAEELMKIKTKTGFITYDEPKNVLTREEFQELAPGLRYDEFRVRDILEHEEGVDFTNPDIVKMQRGGGVRRRSNRRRSNRRSSNRRRSNRRRSNRRRSTRKRRSRSTTKR